MKIVSVVLLLTVLFIFGPIITIWALNILFPVLNIPTNFDTWCATVILGSFLNSSGLRYKE